MTDITPDEFVAEWVADLRRNPPQLVGKLSDGDSWCCLGRACEIGLKHGLVGEKKFSEKNSAMLYDDQEGTLPKALAEFLGMDEEGSFSEEDEDGEVNWKTLIFLNDDLEMSFPQIADRIEELWKSEDFHSFIPTGEDH